MAEMTHAEKIQRHFDIIGKPNPFKAAHAAQARASERKGGLGSGKGAERYQNTSAEDRAKANSDGRFGYFDEVNKRYVPAFIDAIDGGGRDTRGDTFEGGPLSGILNNIGIKPYGSQRERAYGGPTTSPIQQAVAGSGADIDSSVRPRIRPRDNMSDMPDMRMPANPAFLPPTEPFGGPGPDVSTLASQETMERSMGLDPFGGAGMNMDYLDPRAQGIYDSGFRVPPVSTYGGDIDPTQDGRIQAQQNIDNRERMRRAMSQVTQAEYDNMSRGERANMGLPVRGIDLLFAGADAFKQPMVGSGRGQASGDYDFDRFRERVASNPYIPGMSMEDTYEMYSQLKRSGNLGQFM
tara:strand:- start:1076 stop:2128 length:1053 start_codon:yes stop_codon:yes gene_type:complete